MGRLGDGYLEDVGSIDTPGGPQSTDILSIGGQVVGTAAGEDHDWYRVTLTAGTFYSFAASSAEGDLLVTIRDADGHALRFDDDSGAGLNPILTFEAGRSGDYYVDIQNLTDERASYSLSAVIAANPLPGDTITASPSTTGVLAVAGGVVNGLIDAPADVDWYQVSLTAGVHYRFGLSASGASPLDDPYVRVYDSAGVLRAADDDSGEDHDSTLWFTPTQTGLYYVSAEDYADGEGTYQLTATSGSNQNPLDTIDLGTSIDTWILVYFATAGETFDGHTATRSWTAAEKKAAEAALVTYVNYADLHYMIMSDPSMALHLVLDDSLEAAGQLTTSSGLGLPSASAVFNPESPSWTPSSLLPGGHGFSTLLHELGHYLGLAHPHDPGGTSEVMEGVTAPFDSYGTAGLNQGVYTIMSYNDGWPGGDGMPLTTYSYGAASTPMALDIALLHEKYGSDPRNFGNSTYMLGGEMDHKYVAIWDTGGVDEISAAGVAHAVTIDLRAATLLNEPGGGGYLSGWIPQMDGGYTIANGVEIENAVGSAYGDILIGNALTNELSGGEGADVIDGGGGDDIVNYSSATQGVIVTLGSANPQNTGQGLDTLISIESIRGSQFNDQLVGNDGINNLWGFEGDDILLGEGGDDVLLGGAGSNVLYGQAGNDRLRDGEDSTTRDFLFGGSGDDTYYVFSSLTGPLDLVFEGGDNPDVMGDAGDYDQIYAGGGFFWDYYGVAERLEGSEAGMQLVGGTNSQSIFGGDGTQLISAYGGSNRVDADKGTDAISFGLYGLDESYDGVNTLVMKAGNGLDYVYEFESGVDKIDLTAFHFGITGQQVLDQAVNVDQAGTDNDYCYFYLTNAGGVDNYVAFIGLLSNQLQAGDFLT
jgi:hypothetical protein